MSLREAFTVQSEDGQLVVPTREAIAKMVRERYLGEQTGGKTTQENPHRIRRKAIAQRLRFYRGGYEADAAELVDLVFEDRVVKDQRKKLIRMALGMNVTKRVINEISSVYDRPARRSYEDEDAETADMKTERLRRFEKEYRLHQTNKIAHRLLNLCNEILLWHVKSRANGEKRLDIITPDCFDAIADPRDPKVPAGFVIDSDPGFPAVGKARERLPHFEVWDEEAVLYLDKSGRLIAEEENRSGRIPGILLHRDGIVVDDLHDATSGSDLVSAHSAVLFLKLLTLRLAKAQGERQPVLAGLLATMAKGQRMDGESPIALPPGVTLEMLDSKTDPDHYLSVMKSEIAGIAHNYGMSYEQFTFQETGESTSGRAYMVRREKLSELRAEQVENWHRNEAEEMKLIGLGDRGFFVDFRDQGLPQDPKDELEVLDRRMKKGLETPIDYLMRHDPDLTPEKALARIRQNLRVNSMLWDLMRRLNMSADADGQNPGSTPEENGAQGGPRPGEEDGGGQLEDDEGEGDEEADL